MIFFYFSSYFSFHIASNQTLGRADIFHLCWLLYIINNCPSGGITCLNQINFELTRLLIKMLRCLNHEYTNVKTHKCYLCGCLLWSCCTHVLQAYLYLTCLRSRECGRGGGLSAWSPQENSQAQATPLTHSCTVL